MEKEKDCDKCDKDCEEKNKSCNKDCGKDYNPPGYIKPRPGDPYP